MKISLFLLLLGGLLGQTAVSQAKAPPKRPTIWTLEVSRWGKDPMLILLTGFGPFGDIADNPSGRIVEPLARELTRHCGQNVSFEPHQLEVKPGVIDSLFLDRYRKVLSIGVAASSSSIRIETIATNYYYDPETGEGTPIDPNRPTYATVTGGPLPLGIDSPVEGFEVELGGMGTAGNYVCNDTFYRICQKTRAGYFIHIPNTDPKDDSRLTTALGKLACRILHTRLPFDQSSGSKKTPNPGAKF